MSLTTFSIFYYDFEITTEALYLNLDEGSGEITATVQIGSFTPTDLAIAVATALNAVGNNTYTVTFNRDDRTFTIASTVTFDLLVSTGSSAASAYSVIGFTGADRTGASTYTGATCGDFYANQFILQDHISSDNDQQLVSPSVNKSSSGRVEVIRFGVEKFVTFNIKYVTDIQIASDGKIIKYNPTGVADLQRFMQYLITKKPVEFMPNILSRSTFQKLLLESTQDSKDGTGYQLKELYDKGLPNFFETGKLVMRVIED